MIVIGGYNSSNTCNLARICAEHVPTFHIADPSCWCRRRDPPPPVGAKAEVERPRLAARAVRFVSV